MRYEPNTKSQVGWQDDSLGLIVESKIREYTGVRWRVLAADFARHAS